VEAMLRLKPMIVQGFPSDFSLGAVGDIWDKWDLEARRFACKFESAPSDVPPLV
jgi:hypothetical protein